jgi:hypothetical protein
MRRTQACMLHQDYCIMLQPSLLIKRPAVAESWNLGLDRKRERTGESCSAGDWVTVHSLLTSNLADIDSPIIMKRIGDD